MQPRQLFPILLTLALALAGCGPDLGAPDPVAIADAPPDTVGARADAIDSLPETLIARWGHHGDGTLHPGEGELFADDQGLPTADFRKADLDGDGRVSADELRRFLAAQPALPGFTTQALPGVTLNPGTDLTILRRALFSGYLAFAGLKGAGVFLHPAREAVTDSPAAHGWPSTDVTLTAADGVQLQGWMLPAAVPTHRWVVALHGFGGSRQAILATHVAWLRQRFNVLTFDFRNSGRSGGSVTTMGYQERRDAAAAVAFAKSQGASAIGVWGISMGGATAISEAATDAAVACVVDDCAFATLQSAIEARARKKGYPLSSDVAWAIRKVCDLETREHLEDAEPLNWVAKLAPRPLFVIHGLADDETVPKNSQQLFDAAGNPKSLWWVPGATHGQAEETDPTDYQARVLAFFDKNLAEGPTPAPGS